MRKQRKVIYKRGWLISLFVVVLMLMTLFYVQTQANISALPEPGYLETLLALKGRDWFVARTAREVLDPAVPNSAANISQGEGLFGMDCSSCHGGDGRAPTPVGRSMYPRAVNLSSPDVQNLSNRELFWVIKNGIRLSGMPGFARIDTDREIWQLTYYVRSLGKRKGMDDEKGTSLPMSNGVALGR